MCDKRKRGLNFTLDEKKKLLRFLLDHKNPILNKKTDRISNEAKLSAWTEVTNAFNASGSRKRSKESLIKLWEKLKSETKTYCSSSRRSCSQTEGEKLVIKTDHILEQVCEIVGRDSSFNIDVYDSDTDSITVIKQEAKVICIGHSEHGGDISTVLECETPVTGEPVSGFTEPWIERNSDAEQPDASNKPASNTPVPDVEDFKHILLKEELEFKRKLYEIQLKSAEKDIILKDLEIKIRKAQLLKALGDQS